MSACNGHIFYIKESNKFHHDCIFGIPNACEKREDLSYQLAKAFLKHNGLNFELQCGGCGHHFFDRVTPITATVDINVDTTVSTEELAQMDQMLREREVMTRHRISLCRDNTAES